MDENPYESPQSPEISPPISGWIADRPAWGRLELAWPLGYLFALVWLIGSAAMYAMLIGLWMHLEGTTPSSWSVPPQPYYDLAGIVSFGTCTLAAIIIGVMLIVRRKAELHQPWPDWHMALRCLLWSTLIMAPAWGLLAWSGGALRYLPSESEWIGISEVALLGILHGYVCQRGWRYHRPSTRVPVTHGERIHDANVRNAVGEAK